MSTRIIEAYYRAFNAGDFAGMLALLAPEVAHDVNQGGREIGKPAFEVFLARMKDAYREQLREITIFADASGRRFSAEFIVDGVYSKADPGFPAAHGQKYSLPAASFFEVERELITRVTTYYNLADWLEQVSEGRWILQAGERRD
jgi:steroid delta-isomerase-like uncharacterized protein